MLFLLENRSDICFLLFLRTLPVALAFLKIIKISLKVSLANSFSTCVCILSCPMDLCMSGCFEMWLLQDKVDKVWKGCGAYCFCALCWFLTKFCLPKNAHCSYNIIQE